MADHENLVNGVIIAVHIDRTVDDIGGIIQNPVLYGLAFGAAIVE
jgi:hypothetical protein